MTTEELEPLPPDVEQLLRKGRPGYEPPRAAREAVLSFIADHAVALGTAGLAAGAAGAARGGIRGAWGALKGSFGIGGIVVGVAAGAAGHAIVSSPGDPPTVAATAAPTAATSAPATVTPVPSAPPEVAVADLPMAPAPAAPRVEATTHAEAAKDKSASAEQALIDMARTAVMRGQSDAAIATLARHAREFPLGAHVEEREWLWIQALVATGETDAAKARAIRFRKAFPESLMLPALDRALPEGARPPAP
jgi:hypothetical protein